MKCSFCGRFRAEDDLTPVHEPRGWFDETESREVICSECIHERHSQADGIK